MIDTQILIWFFNGDEKLSAVAKSIIEDPSIKCFVSVASLWEIAIRTSLGKLKMQGDLYVVERFLQLNDIIVLPIEVKDLYQLTLLPFLHKDPFDRLILSQSINRSIPLITRDEKLLLYKHPTVSA